MTIRPVDVVAQYFGASSLDERRASHELYRTTNAIDVCRMARELGYASLDVSVNSVWREYWILSARFS